MQKTQIPQKSPVQQVAEKYSIPQQDGVLVVYKPQGITSAACIARIKHGFNQKKIGHAGTLDPMAQGVLLVLLGQATKLSSYLMGDGEKVYSGSICLGVTTDTWDAEGQEIERSGVAHISEEQIRVAFQEFVGTYEQEVPAYSAAKHEGQPLYALARAGKEVPVKSKEITIFRGEVELVNLPHVRFRVSCSSGTYIRSLAHSLGKRLGCGAMLEELVREYSHPFGLAEACTLDTLAQEPESFLSKVQSIAKALPSWPKVQVSPEEAARLKNGMTIPCNLNVLGNMAFMPGMKGVLLEADGKALCLAETCVKDGQQVWALLRGLWNQKQDV